MSSNTLSGAGISPANTKAQLLHIGTGNLAAGAVVKLGDGTSTPLTISAAGISVDGAVAATSVTATNMTTTGLTVTNVTAGGGGTLTLTGGLTLSGKLVFTGIQALSGAGAVNVTDATTLFTSTGASQALTLADGTHGQIKTIVHAVDGGSGILTPTTKTGYSTITFTAAGDSVTLQFFTTRGWCILASRGVTIA